MPNPSPVCQVQIGSGAFVPTTDGVDVSALDALTVRLADTSGVTSWSLTIIGTDDGATDIGGSAYATPAITSAGTAPATLTAPDPGGAGATLILQSVVNNGVVNGQRDASLTTTFLLAVLPSGVTTRLIAYNQTTEGAAAVGWIKEQNACIRAIGSGGGGSGGGNVFVFDPSATPAGNVYADFSALTAAAAATGLPVVVSIGPGITVPAGNYELPSAVTLSSAADSCLPGQVYLADGCEIYASAVFLDRIWVTSQSATPVFYTLGTALYVRATDSVISASTAPVFDTVGAEMTLALVRAELTCSGGATPLAVYAGFPSTIAVHNHSKVSNAAIQGGEGATCVILNLGASTYIGEQPGFLGTIERSNWAPADRLVLSSGGIDGGNVFSTWPRLFAAIPTGAPVDIYFPAGTHTIPSGTWTLPEGSTLRGAGRERTTIILDEDCDLRFSSLTLEGLHLGSAYAHTMTATGALAYLTTRDVYIVGEFVVIDASSGATVLFSDDSEFGAKAIDLGDGGTLGLIAGDGTVVGASAIHGLGSATLSIGLAGLAVVLPASFSPAFTGILTPYVSAFSAHGKKIADLADPTSAQDAATKGYADSLIVDASTSVKGVAKLSAAPVSPTDPIAVGDNDSRMTNARTPTSHASSHQNGGGDEIATATAGANAIPKAGGAGTLAIGWIPTGTSSSTVCIGNDSRLSDSRPASSVSESVLRASAAGLTAALAVNSQKITGVAAGTASGDALSFPASSAAGDILYCNGTTWTRLPAGTTGYKLTAAGAAAPTWDAPPSVSVVSSNKSLAYSVSTSSTTYTTPTGSASVTVTVPASGKVLVWLSVGATITSTFATLHAAPALSGANTVSAATNETNGYAVDVNPAVANVVSAMSGGGSACVMSGLSPGDTTFTVQIRTENAAKPMYLCGHSIAVMPLP